MADAKVDSASTAYQELAKHWQLPDDMLGGTMQMRRRSREGACYGDSGGGHYLAQHEHESAGAYESRLSQSYLFPGYEEALGGLAGRPFQKATTLGAETTEVAVEAHGQRRGKAHRSLP